MKRTKELILLTGSNIEPRLDFLKKAEIEIEKRVGKILKSSNVYESEPWGFFTDGSFLNKVLIVKTALSALKALDMILNIEKMYGRERSSSGYASRTLDIDILYFGDEVVEDRDLILPHPRLDQRRFTLMPLVEVAPDFIHPILKLSSTELLQNVNDESKVWTYQHQEI